MPARSSGGPVRPGELDRARLGGAAGLVAVPADVDTLRHDDRELLLRWRMALRTSLREAFAAGLVAVDVDRDAGPGVAAYVLERNG
jgi:predicted GNAT superfamily acetyltransferase